MTNPTNKEGLLTAVTDSRHAFTALIKGINTAQMEIPGVEASWSVKDIVAHICSWEASMCRWLDMTMRGETPDRPLSDADIDQMNAAFTAVNAQKSLETVLAEFMALEAQIMTTITAVPENDLFDLGRFSWRSPESPLWYMVGGNTFWHYEEHTETIQKWCHENTNEDL